jgi:hypothetical protein
MKKPLSTEASRTDMTDRECAAILGSIIGGLAHLSDVATVRNAVRWWAETDEAWQHIAGVQAAVRGDGSRN